MHQVFSTYIYQNRIKFDLKDLKKECFQIQKVDHSGVRWSQTNYRGGYTSYGSWDQLHKLSSSFAALEKSIKGHVVKYANKLNYRFEVGQVRVNSIWLNIMPPGSHHSAHIHPKSVISGTFYVETPKNCSSIKFEDPRLGFFMNRPEVKKQPGSKSCFYQVLPKAGDVVLFESWLRHEVPFNDSKVPRISISFNYDL